MREQIVVVLRNENLVDQRILPDAVVLDNDRGPSYMLILVTDDLYTAKKFGWYKSSVEYYGIGCLVTSTIVRGKILRKIGDRL